MGRRSERCCGGDHQSQNVPALLHIDEKRRIGTTKRVRCDGTAIDKKWGLHRLQ